MMRAIRFGVQRFFWILRSILMPDPGVSNPALRLLPLPTDSGVKMDFCLMGVSATIEEELNPGKWCFEMARVPGFAVVLQTALRKGCATGYDSSENMNRARFQGCRCRAGVRSRYRSVRWRTLYRVLAVVRCR